MSTITDGFLEGIPVAGFMVTTEGPPRRGRVTFRPEARAEAERAQREGRALSDTITGRGRIQLTDQVAGPELSFDWIGVDG